ncbi:MAG: Penicillin-binding protein 2 [Candidatus Moranbacteria bacterium GW2011_GWA2_39_41]|nr:MAG: Penicillin-binding protein 2 [Candidatus Moranbacteria bacterium GW2011_GWA2_39_41]
MFKRYFNNRRMSHGMEIEDSIMTVTQKEKAIMEIPFERHGLGMVWFVIVFFLGIFVVRIAYLDIIRGGYYSDISKGNRIRSITVKAPRGKILDRSGQILASNIPSMDAIIIPSDLPEDNNKKQLIADSVANILGMEKNQISSIFEVKNRNSLDPILVKENITREQALILAGKAKELPGVLVENTAIRSYEDSNIFSSVLGYDGKVTKDEMAKNPEYMMTDYIGKSAIEKQYEKELRGKAGTKQVEVDSLGNVKKNLGVINSQAGNDLVLNIDADLQKKLYDSMAGILEKTDTHTAAAVAIDPRDGGVLAIVNFPNYDNNLFARGISNIEYQEIINNKDLPLLNRAVNGEYPPGSTLKMAVAAAALSEETITAETIINGMGGSINIGGFRFRDWKTHAPSDIRTAIAESNDIFFYSIGGGYGNIPGLGMNRMKKYENMFGFGNPTGIDLPTEASGFIPDEQWKLDNLKEKWYIGNSYHASIGQGFVTTTPLQIANYAAALANGGTLFVPRIVNQIKTNEGKIIEKRPEIIRKNFISDAVIQVVREGMRKTVTDGTAQPLKNLPVEVAGKTGTAEFGGEGKTHGWFVSFAPYDNPVIALAILAEGGGEGHSSGVPITKEVYEYYFNRKIK